MVHNPATNSANDRLCLLVGIFSRTTNFWKFYNNNSVNHARNVLFPNITVYRAS